MIFTIFLELNFEVFFNIFCLFWLVKLPFFQILINSFFLSSFLNRKTRRSKRRAFSRRHFDLHKFASDSASASANFAETKRALHFAKTRNESEFKSDKSSKQTFRADFGDFEIDGAASRPF